MRLATNTTLVRYAMLNLGAHISIAGGYAKATQTAIEMNANTFQFFTRNPRGGKAKAIDPDDIRQAEALMADKPFATLIAHAPYTLNLCSVDEKVREFGEMIFMDDMARLTQIPPAYYNFHPGTRKESSIDEAVALIAAVLNQALDAFPQNTVLLEAMSGKGSEVGRNFEELKLIIDAVKKKDNIGICIDLCHLYSAGYDIVRDLDGVFTQFDRIIGLSYLKAAHINDSMHPLGSHKDRHARLGEGTIGLDAVVRFINHPTDRKSVV